MGNQIWDRHLETISCDRKQGLMETRIRKKKAREED